LHFKPYHIAVSTTLVISGASLLVTLAGLLVAVPVRKWRMDKWIGWGLVATWAVSTAVNVLVEVLGFSSDVS
jgi:sodium/potassium/calcium exchanger 6